MADDADLLVIIDILGLGVVVDAIVDFVGSFDKLFRIQLNVTCAYRASVTSKDVLRCHPEFSVFLANDRDLIDSGGIINFGEIVFVAVDGDSLPNELLGVAGNLLTSNLTTATRATNSLQMIGRPLHKRSVFGTYDFYQRVGIDIDRLGIVVEIAVGLLCRFYEGFRGVPLILRSFGASVALDVITGAYLELAMLRTDNRHEVLSGLVIDF